MERSLFYICCGKQSSQGVKFQCEGQGCRDPKTKAHQGREQRFKRWVMSLHVCTIYQASAKTVRRDYMQQVIQGLQQRTQPFIKDPQQHSAYPASRGYIFAVWAVVQKVASADNYSIFYCACMKFVTRFASKINHQVCCQMARVSRE